MVKTKKTHKSNHSHKSDQPNQVSSKRKVQQTVAEILPRAEQKNFGIFTIIWGVLVMFYPYVLSLMVMSFAGWSIGILCFALQLAIGVWVIIVGASLIKSSKDTRKDMAEMRREKIKRSVKAMYTLSIIMIIIMGITLLPTLIFWIAFNAQLGIDIPILPVFYILIMIVTVMYLVTIRALRKKYRLK